MTKAEIQLVRSLADKRSRDQSGLFVAEGGKLVGEILRSPFRVRKLYTCGERFGTAFEEPVSRSEMERMSSLKTPSGALAVVEIPRRDFDAAGCRSGLVLALDEVQNPGNMGTIVRLADWFGIGDVICSPGCADCFNPKVVQATMGAILRVRVHYLDLAAELARAAGEGIPVYGTFLDGENIYRAPLSPTGIVVMGNEGRGVSDPAARSVTRRLYIPPFPEDTPGSESLNVAVATAIVCSEFRRR